MLSRRPCHRDFFLAGGTSGKISRKLASHVIVGGVIEDVKYVINLNASVIKEVNLKTIITNVNDQLNCFNFCTQ